MPLKCSKNAIFMSFCPVGPGNLTHTQIPSHPPPDVPSQTVIFPLNFLARYFFGDLYLSLCLSRSMRLAQACARIGSTRGAHSVNTRALSRFN